MGFGADDLAAIGAFGLAYAAVAMIEPIAELGAFGLAKAPEGRGLPLVSPCLYAAGIQTGAALQRAAPPGKRPG